MATKEMTMHELLVAIKTTKKNLDGFSITPGTMFVTTAERGVMESNPDQTEKAKVALTGNLQRMKALISNLEAYERARALSNATTKVTIGGKEMTVSDAIKMKENIVYKLQLVSKLKDEYAAATKSCASANEKLRTRLDRNYTYSSDATPETITAMQAAKDAEYNKGETILVDPNHAEDTINQLNDEISAFNDQIDSALSYSNAVTTVTVELAD